MRQITKNLFLFLVLAVTSSAAKAQLIINEFSNGTSGTKEFIELVVTGTPGTFQDIRGWIIDDHSGFYGCGSGRGIASGHIRFSNIQQWACVPVGSIILIYNPGDVNSNLNTPNDYSDADNDGIYVLDVTATGFFEANTQSPNVTSCNVFTPAYTTVTNWNPLGLGNSVDALLIMNPNNLSAPHHAVGYGNLNPVPPIYFTGNGGGTNYSFTNTISNDPFIQGNWSANSASSFDTPASANGSENQKFIDSLKLHIITSNQSGCAPLQVQFDANSADPNYTYTWDFNDGNSASSPSINHTFTGGGNYNVTLTVTGLGGCSMSTNYVISVTSGNSGNLTFLDSVCENEPPFTLPDQNTKTWSGAGVTQNTFSPAKAGTGTHFISSPDSACPGVFDTLQLFVASEPEIDWNLPERICGQTDSVFIGTANPAGGTYSGANVINDYLIAHLTNDTTTTLYYEYNDAVCFAKDSQTVKIDSLPLAEININNNKPCEGDTVIASTRYYPNINWSNGQNSKTIFVIKDNTLQLTVENSCGRDTSTVKINFNPAPYIQLPDEMTLCNEETELLIEAEANVLPYWNTDDSSMSISVSEPGTYHAEHTNACGSATAKTNVYLETGEVEIESDPAGRGKQRLFAVPSTFKKYTWIINGSEEKSNDEPFWEQHVGKNRDFEIEVRATDFNGCIYSDTLLMKSGSVHDLFIPNIFTPNGDGMNDKLRVVSEDYVEYQAEVFNRWGQLIYSWRLGEQGWDGTNNGKLCSDGVYVIRVQAYGESRIGNVQLLTR